jgi:hypothetical protein
VQRSHLVRTNKQTNKQASNQASKQTPSGLQSHRFALLKCILKTGDKVILQAGRQAGREHVGTHETRVLTANSMAVIPAYFQN